MRLLVHVEGPTEEDFVNELLRGHLMAVGYETVSAPIVGNARLRRMRGGIRPWSAVKKDILYHLQEDIGCIATTMVDYYGLPKEGARAWPGRDEAAKRQSAQKALCVEDALLRDITSEMGHKFNPSRFVPFVVMHEFEGLLFSDCVAFSRGIGRSALEADFSKIRQQFATPEDINDSATGAPSKRIEALVPGYEKPLLGALAAIEIGLARIRSECVHFADWLSRLESLVS
jgi:hypothetical protein